MNITVTVSFESQDVVCPEASYSYPETYAGDNADTIHIFNESLLLSRDFLPEN